MRAAEIAKACGGVYRSGPWWRCVCPVHGSRTGRRTTLSLRDGDYGLIAVCHAGCAWTDVMDELRRRGLIGDFVKPYRAPRPHAVPVEPDDVARRIAQANRTWNKAQEPRETPAAAYFLGRGLDITLLHSLRYAASLRRCDGTYGPAVVARVDDVKGGLVAIHRTWIGPDESGVWRRLDRKAMGPSRGGAVRLAPAAETLMVGEGIETSAAAMLVVGMPAWAALSTSGLISLVLPSIVQQVILLADHDASGAGERAAHKAAQRWLTEGRMVRIAMPPQPDTDFNDILLGKIAA
jgi:putative DNA primase/helicase